MIDAPQPPLEPPLTFDSAIQKLFPRKASTLLLTPWSNETNPSYTNTIRTKNLKQITTLLRVLSSDNTPTATELTLDMLKNIADTKDYALNEIIVNNMSTFLNDKLTNNKNATIEAKCTIVQATLVFDKSLQASIKDRLGVGKRMHDKIINTLDENISNPYSLMIRPHEASFLQKLQRQSTYDFVHSDEASRLDS